LRSTAVGLTTVLVLGLSVGSVAYAMNQSAQEAVVGTPAANGDAGGGWSWIALVSFYVALVVLGPTIGSWWVLWSRRDEERRRGPR
jgi:hypothetical protein